MLHFLADSSAAAALQARFATQRARDELSYATVRDYCESTDLLPQITGRDGDLKNVQRPWMVKAVLSRVAPPARVLEIGGGEPIVSGMLSDLGYDVTLIDPYDGFGNGPLEYDAYVERFPGVRIVRGYLDRGTTAFDHNSFDAVLSVSVLEHIPREPLGSCFEGIAQFLKAGAPSIHCFDFIVRGVGADYARETAREILRLQSELAQIDSRDETALLSLIEMMQGDLETFYLSPQGHNNWRGSQAYDQFPFRQVVSIQTVVGKAAQPAGGLLDGNAFPTSMAQ